MPEGTGMEDVSSYESQDLENMDLAPFEMRENESFLGRGEMSAQEDPSYHSFSESNSKNPFVCEVANAITLVFLCHSPIFQVLSITRGQPSSDSDPEDSLYLVPMLPWPDITETKPLKFRFKAQICHLLAVRLGQAT